MVDVDVVLLEGLVQESGEGMVVLDSNDDILVFERPPLEVDEVQALDSVFFVHGLEEVVGLVHVHEEEVVHGYLFGEHNEAEHDEYFEVHRVLRELNELVQAGVDQHGLQHQHDGRVRLEDVVQVGDVPRPVSLEEPEESDLLNDVVLGKLGGP